jgi:hypothetical protein
MRAATRRFTRGFFLPIGRVQPSNSKGMFFLGPTLFVTRPHRFEAVHLLLGSCEPLNHVGQAIFSDRFSPWRSIAICR